MSWKSLVITLVMSSSLFGMNLKVRSINNEGVDKFQTKEFLEANQKFLKAVGAGEFTPLVYFNAASSYFAVKDYENSKKLYHFLLKALKGADKAISDENQRKALNEILFKTYFNLGVIAQTEKKIEESLKNYQFALDIHPTDIAAKINIELMMAQQQSKSKGQNKDKDDKKDKNQEQKKDQKGQGDQKKDKKPQPSQGDQKKKKKKRKKQKFDSKEMSKQDLKRILKELKRQEESIRAKMNRKSSKERGLDKDW